MSEDDWLQVGDVKRMLLFLSEKASERKLRLFCLACCGHICQEFTDLRSWDAAGVLAAYADGNASAGELHEAWRQATAVAVDDGPAALSYGGFARQLFWNFGPSYDPVPRLVADATAASVRDAALACAKAPFPRWRRFVVRMLHDLFGNPFRPFAVPPASVSDSIRATAKRIYDRGRSCEMPMFADALEAAGVVQDEILRHCRQPGLHARGCWVLDLVLGKE